MSGISPFGTSLIVYRIHLTWLGTRVSEEHRWYQYCEFSHLGVADTNYVLETKPHRKKGNSYVGTTNVATPSVIPAGKIDSFKGVATRSEEDERIRHEFLVQALANTNCGRVPVKDGAQRTVKEVLMHSSSLARHALSVSLEIEDADGPVSFGSNHASGSVHQEARSPADKPAGAERLEYWEEEMAQSVALSKHDNHGRRIAVPHPELCAEEAEPNPMSIGDNLIPPSTMGAASSEPAGPPTLVEEAIQAGVWGLERSQFITPVLEPQSSEIPKCTASQGLSNWRITNSLLKAYAAMRGSYQLAGRDLYVWMDRCSKSFDKPQECDEHTGSCNS